MEVLWEKSPQTLMELVRVLKARVGWAKSTVNTMVARMEAKNLLIVDEGGKARRYSPAITRDEAARSETDSLLERVFNGSVGMMMSTLVSGRRLSEKDIEELYAILQAAEKKEGESDA